MRLYKFRANKKTRTVTARADWKLWGPHVLKAN
jgi:hypothetical protein